MKADYKVFSGKKQASSLDTGHHLSIYATLVACPVDSIRVSHGRSTGIRGVSASRIDLNAAWRWR